mgnify:CR=1 FL=1|tara:strand:+ start:3402 stop:4391 length:990 start_codon:yes stop_codon:yes gene_type:complete
MKRAIVTGGAGFIGSHMVDLLLSKNFKVIVVDDLSGGHTKNIKQHFKNKNFSLKKKNILTIKPDDKIFNKVDYVFHFAGIGDIVPSIEKPTTYMQVNVQGTVNILEASRFHNVKKLVYAASASCYGLTKKLTNEKYRINNEHPYALSKYLGESSVFHWNKVYKLPVNSIRIFNAYGPRVRTTGAYGAVIGVFFKQKLQNEPLTIVGSGKQTRDFVHVKDVVRAFYLASQTKKSGQIYNVGTGKPQSVNYLAKLVGGKRISLPDRPGEPKISSADNSKIRRDLNWYPNISFEEGIGEMLKNIQNWKDAPLWTPKKIKKATSVWFKYLKSK